MTTPKVEDGKSAPIPLSKAIRIIFQTLAVLIILGGLLFIPAGRLDWEDAWAYLIGYSFFLLAYAAWGLFKDPGQLRERSLANSAKTSKPWDRVILSIYTVFLVALFVVCSWTPGGFNRFLYLHQAKELAGLDWL